MTSTRISRISAGLLFVGGASMLFAPDVVLPRLVPGYPAGGLWLGQLLGAAWLGAAALDWLSRRTVIGGIYGRPVVVANLALYFIAAMVLLREAVRADAAAALWVLFGAAAVMASAYGWLLFRGPFAGELGGARARGSGEATDLGRNP